MATYKTGFIAILIAILSTTAHAQTVTVGITVRTIHFSKKSSVTGKKYNNWNPGISVGYVTKDNITFETALILNSYKKLAWVAAVGYRHGDFEIQLGGATGYKCVGQPWMRPGYFVNYYGEEIKLKLNHEIINFGLTKQYNQ